MNASHKHFLASALMLAATLGASPLWAAQSNGANPTTHTAMACQSAPVAKSDNHEISRSRINGRADWDIDYPSQLAPDALPSSYDMDSVAAGTTHDAHGHF